MRCAVVAYENRNLSFKEKFRKNQKDYCAKHGYEYICYDTYALSIPPYWLKPFIVRDHLRDFDCVLWIDSDACFENMNTRIEDVIGEGSVMTISADKPQHRFPAKINTGVFIVTKSSLQMIEEWIALYNPSTWKEINGTWKCSGKWSGIDYEQGALCTLLEKYPFDIKPWHYMNNHPRSGHAGYVYHYCGAVGKGMLKHT